MSEDINERAKRIRAAEASKAASEEAARAAAGAREIVSGTARQRDRATKRALAQRFASWAISNRIPLDRSRDRDVRGPRARLMGRPPVTRQYRTPLPAGWILVDDGGCDADDGKNRWHRTLVVARDGNVVIDETKDYYRPPYPDDDPIDRVSIDQVLDGIARHVAQHNIPWE